MLRHHPLFWLTIVVFACATRIAHAQTPSVALICDAPPQLIDPDALQSAIERELSMPVQRARDVSGPSLRIRASALDSVEVSFMSPAHPDIARSVDVSARGIQVVDTLALLAANLLRDEAAELLPGLPPPTAAAPPPLCPDFGLRRIPFGVDFLPRVGMSTSGELLRAERAISLNAIGGLSGAVRGVELGGVFNLDVHGLCGAQLAGTLNYVGGPVTGAQLAVINFALGPLTGAQLGLVNMDFGDLRGAQLGLLNIDSGHVSGAQLGLLNITHGENHGAMIGLVNIADDADAAIGLLDIIWHGRTQLDAWATDAGLIMAGVMHGSRYVHNIYGVGIKPMSGAPALAIALGLGVRVLETERFTLDIDAVHYGLMHRSSAQNRIEWGEISQLRVPFAITLVQGVAVFVAPEVSVGYANADTDFADPALYKTTRLSARGASKSARFWPGLSLGLRFL